MTKHFFFICILISIHVCLAAQSTDQHDQIPARDVEDLPFQYRLYVDQISQNYITGEIDPAIALIPPSLNSLVFTNPALGIPKLVSFLQTNGGSAGPAENDYHMVKRLHDWITNNVAYDNYLFWGMPHYTGSRHPGEFLQYYSGPRTTCGGFARLFKELADEAGITAEYIDGYARSYGSYGSRRIGNHAWNAVQINNKWYVVDCTADGRIGQTGDERSELRRYKDSSLFIAPEAKLIGNLAYKPEQQYISNPISLDDYMNMPRYYRAFMDFDIRLPENSFLSKREKYLIPKQGGNLYSVYDSYKAEQGYLKFQMLCPKDSYMYANIYDSESNAYPHRTFLSYDNYSSTHNVVNFTFSIPEAGHHKVIVYAKKLSGIESGRTVYKFYCHSDGKTGDLLPVKDNFIPQMKKEKYDIRFSDIEMNVEKNGFYSFKIDYSDDTEIYTGIYGINTERPEKHLFYTYNSPTSKSYFISRPRSGDYIVYVYAKKKGEQKFNDKIAIFRIESRQQGPQHFPQSVPKLHTRFFEYGLKPLQTEPTENNGVYSYSIEANPGIELSCSLIECDKQANYMYDDNDKTIKPALHYSYTYDGNIYTFYFSPGKTVHENSMYIAKMYVKDQGRYYSIAEFLLPSSKNNSPLIPYINTVFTKYTLYELDIDIKVSDSQQARNDGFYTLNIEYPADVDLYAIIEDKTGGKYYPGTETYYNSDFRTRSFNINGQTVYLCPPTEDFYRVRIAAKPKDVRSYNTVAEFMIHGGTVKPQLMPPPFRFISYQRFHEDGFSLVSENLLSVEEDGVYAISIKAPRGIEMRCRLRDENNNNVKGHYHVENEGDLWNFRFSPPKAGRYFCKIYSYKEGRYDHIANFYIESKAAGPLLE